MSEFGLGVHNDRYNIDYYKDGSIMIYDHMHGEEITVFDEDTVALFMSLMDKDGHLDRLLKIERERLIKSGFNKIRPIDLHNEGSYEFIDISSEKWRIYHFPSGETVKIRGDWLSVSKSGHRVLDSDGVSHFIPFGWTHLEWKADPHFVK